MAIPYQPTFTINPKYGFRYAAQPHIPNVSNGNLNTSQATPPPSLGTQQSTPPQPQQQQASYMNDPFPQGIDKRPIAQSLGYTAPRSNLAAGLGTIAGMATGVPFLGTMMGSAADKLDQSGKPAYGSFGTYDAEGNVFGEQGRAYDPITGAAVPSFKDTGTFLGSTFGIGSDYEFLGPETNYGKLRAEGEGIGSSLLGSYDNSIYNVSRADRMAGYTPAGLEGINTINAQARRNAEIMSQEDYDEADLANITAAQLGFTKDRPAPTAPSSGTYAYGTGAGDVFTTGGSYQTGVINESGQIETPTGTVVQTNDSQGNTISLLGTPEENFSNLDYLSNTTDDFGTKDNQGSFGVGGGNTFNQQVAEEKKVSIDEFGGKGNDTNDTSGGK